MRVRYHTPPAALNATARRRLDATADSRPRLSYRTTGERISHGTIAGRYRDGLHRTTVGRAHGHAARGALGRRQPAAARPLHRLRSPRLLEAGVHPGGEDGALD